MGIRASSIKPLPTRWVVSDRVPEGQITLIGGREGLGKSLLTVDWGAQATHGRLSGDLEGPIRVTYVLNEDDLARTAVPRLMAAGADLGRVDFVNVRLDSGATVPLVLPLDTVALRQHIEASDTRLVIIDPLVSVLDGKLDTHKDHSIRQALDRLGQLAQETGTAVIALVHHGKSTTGDMNDRVLGSRAFTAAARAVLAVVSDPDDATTRLVVQAKNNLGRMDLPALAFTVDGATVSTAQGPASVGTLRWLPPRAVDLDDLMNTGTSEERTERDEAGRWLIDYLTTHGGEGSASDLRKAAAGAGLAWRTVQRARARVGVETVRSGFGAAGGTLWQIAGESPTRAVRAGGIGLGTSGTSGTKAEAVTALFEDAS